MCVVRGRRYECEEKSGIDALERTDCRGMSWSSPHGDGRSRALSLRRVDLDDLDGKQSFSLKVKRKVEFSQDAVHTESRKERKHSIQSAPLRL